MRPFLLRLLLLAVFLNTAVGMPLHGAQHLKHSAPAAGALLAASALAEKALPQGDDAPEEHDEAAHRLCLWCAASVQPAHPPADLLRLCPAPISSDIIPWVASSGWPELGRDHWPFASRDPPAPA